jgi:hypothetical protein
MQFRLAGCLLLCSVAVAQTIPPDEAAGAFAVARQISRRDAGKTWGVEVCGPLFFADPSTRDVVANQADAEGRLKQAGDVWRGSLPASISIANTDTEWGGVHWTMVMWPLPADTRSRAQLLGHECYHRIQSAIELRGADLPNNHLDGAAGRIWMLLEWRALERALIARGEARRAAIADALTFRRYRRSAIPKAAAPENSLEMNEGLAEYTGVRLANADPADRTAAAVFMLRDGPRRASLVRSFAYASGPAYGVLLDDSGAEWRRALTPASDLGEILGKAYRIPAGPASEAAARMAAAQYGGDEVMEAETLRARKLEKQLTDLRRKFIEGPVLMLPNAGEFSFGFDPNGLVPLDENSAVYVPLRVTDTWGVLEADGGGLMIREKGLFSRAVVPAPVNGNLSGDGWKLDLKPGFRVVPGARKGDFTVVREVLPRLP